MLAALESAHRTKWTHTDELLRKILLKLDLIWRQTIVYNGGEPPEPMVVPRPGDPPPRQPTVREIALQAAAHAASGR